MRVLVLGAGGMIGRAMFKVLAQRTDWCVIGSVRAQKYDGSASGAVLTGVDLSNAEHLSTLFLKAKPNVVINCVGLTKHIAEGNQHIPALTMNALLPHRLADYCALVGARFIHVSTDCVFTGSIGNYSEDDITDSTDVYGRTKALGEVREGNVLTLRTSTIGHEYDTKFGLLEWFLSQTQCRGYSRAIFSGLPTVEFARVVRDFVIPDSSLKGLYHVGAASIDKLTLLNLINESYKTQVQIARDDTFHIDRSLNSDRFAAATGYKALPWPSLIQAMYKDYIEGEPKNV